MTDYYFADTGNTTNVGVGEGIFGRFSAVVRCDRSGAFQIESGEWVGRGPNGCTIGNYDTKEEAEFASSEMFIRKGWTDDRSLAVLNAKLAAQERHNSHVRASRGYAKTYGPEIHTEGNQ